MYQMQFAKSDSPLVYNKAWEMKQFKTVKLSLKQFGLKVQN